MSSNKLSYILDRLTKSCRTSIQKRAKLSFDFRALWHKLLNCKEYTQYRTRLSRVCERVRWDCSTVTYRILLSKEFMNSLCFLIPGYCLKKKQKKQQHKKRSISIAVLFSSRLDWRERHCCCRVDFYIIKWTFLYFYLYVCTQISREIPHAER